MRVSVPSFKGSSSRLSHLGKSLSLGLGPWQLPPSAPLPPAEIALIVSGRMVERGGHKELTSFFSLRIPLIPYTLINFIFHWCVPCYADSITQDATKVYEQSFKTFNYEDEQCRRRLSCRGSDTVPARSLALAGIPRRCPGKDDYGREISCGGMETRDPIQISLKNRCTIRMTPCHRRTTRPQPKSHFLSML